MGIIDENGRRVGHSALRVRDGQLETFDPHPDRGRWMQMASGRLYYPYNPRPEEVHVEDVAHHLGMLCRFTGACRDFYSVAEHSVLVSYFSPPGLELCGLMHDAPEGYLNDINAPVKSFPQMEGYRVLEQLNWLAVSARFGLPSQIPVEVKQVDRAMYFAERAVLMPPLPEGTVDMYPSPIEVPKVTIRCYPPHEARWLFLKRFAELTP